MMQNSGKIRLGLICDFPAYPIVVRGFYFYKKITCTLGQLCYNHIVLFNKKKRVKKER